MKKNNANINIRRIAQLAGVSAATVSRVINTPDKVRAQTRMRVNEIIDSMNYIPKTSVPPNSKIIAYMTDLGAPFYTDVMKKLTTYAAEKGYYVIGYNIGDNPEFEATMFEYFKRANFAGIILTGLSKLKNVSAEIPVVLLDAITHTEGSYYNITSDNEKAIHILVDYLIRLNHRRIGFISGGSNSSSGREREKIFVSYMNELGLSSDCIFDGDFKIKSGFSAFDYFFSLSDKPTAVIASNDEMAKGFITRASSMGVDIPRDISICGIDSIDGDYFIPKITSICQDADGAARHALDYILSQEKNVKEKQVILPVSFTPGSTCYKLQD